MSSSPLRPTKDDEKFAVFFSLAVAAALNGVRTAVLSVDTFGFPAIETMVGAAPDATAAVADVVVPSPN